MTTLVPLEWPLAMAVCKHYYVPLLKVEDWCIHDKHRLGNVYSGLLAHNSTIHAFMYGSPPHGSTKLHMACDTDSYTDATTES